MKSFKYLSFFLFFIFCIYLIFIPNVSVLEEKNPDKTSFMKFREEEWKKENKNYKIKQKWVPYSRISLYIKKAAIISEDEKFWQHDGFDYDAIKKAFERNIKSKKIKFGGSTITQQLAKNLYLSPSKNPVRKIREAIITWQLERNLHKKRILELYLNVIEWGDKGIFGIEAASMHHFGKHASDISAYEAALLISILPNPRRYKINSRYVKNRANVIYTLMIRHGIVNIYDSAK